MRVLLLCVGAFAVGLLAGALFWPRGEAAWDRLRTPRESAAAPASREREPVALRAGGGDVGEFAREEAADIERSFPRDSNDATGTITGTVCGPAGEPIAGAVVSAFPTTLPSGLWPARRRVRDRRHEDVDFGDAARDAIRRELWRRRSRHVATSGADGRYEMRVLSKTNYCVSISYSLHAYHERYDVKPITSARDCAPGSVVHFQAQPVVSVPVEVRLPDGTLARSAWLSWRGPHGSGYHSWAPTLNHVRLPVGSCTVRAQAWVPDPFKADVACTVGPESAATTLLLQLRGQSLLRAHLVLPDGLAMPDSVEYRLRRLLGSESPDPAALAEDRTAQRSPQGFWIDLAPGRHLVAAFSGHRLLAHAIAEVEEGPIDVDLEMADPTADRHLIVKVLGPEGGLAAGRARFRVAARIEDRARFYWPNAMRRSDGTWLLPLTDVKPLSGGEYALRVHVGEYGEVERPIDLAGPGSIAVRFGEPARVRLRVRGLGDTDLAGRLYAGLVGELSASYQRPIMSDGSCELACVQPGEYGLQLILSEANERWPIVQRQVALTAGDHEHAMEVPVVHALHVRAAGLRAYRVMLSCKDPAVGTFERSARASDGVAVFRGLGPGSYEIECRGKRLAVRVPGPEVTIE